MAVTLKTIWPVSKFQSSSYRKTGGLITKVPVDMAVWSIVAIKPPSALFCILK